MNRVCLGLLYKERIIFSQYVRINDDRTALICQLFSDCCQQGGLSRSRLPTQQDGPWMFLGRCAFQALFSELLVDTFGFRLAALFFHVRYRPPASRVHVIAARIP